MTRKDYIAIATELRYQKPYKIASPKAHNEKIAVWRNVVLGIATVLQSDNNRFDMQRFTTACELE